MDLAMEGREESTKVKFFLYIIGGQGREIYDTSPFTIDPGKCTLKAAIDVFEAHCNPKKMKQWSDIRFSLDYKKIKYRSTNSYSTWRFWRRLAILAPYETRLPVTEESVEFITQSYGRIFWKSPI